MKYRVRKERLLGEDVAIPEPREYKLPDLEPVLAFQKALFRHELNARKRCDRIEATAPEAQRFLVLKHRNAYISLPVIEELLRRVRRNLFTLPRRAEEFTRIALLIAEELNPGLPHVASITLCREVRARCVAHLGNVCRILCQWPEAESHLEEARQLLWEGAGDAEVMAEVQSLRGSFLRDTLRFGEALDAMEESAALYEELGETHQAGLVYLNVADTLRVQGKADRALPIHIKASFMVDEEKLPAAAAAAWNNLARIYLALGKSEEADALLASAPSFYERCPVDSSVHHDRAWTEGLVHFHQHRHNEALERLQTAFRGYAALRDAYNAGLVQLDRLQVLLAAGHLEEVERAAASVHELLREEPLEREAKAAVQVLQAAASQHRLVRSIIEEAAVALRNSLPIRPR
jgi:tetratricopeptide (TPR) repeat protein